MAIAPASVITIDSTVAKIGRSMKKRENMAYGCWPSSDGVWSAAMETWGATVWAGAPLACEGFATPFLPEWGVEPWSAAPFCETPFCEAPAARRLAGRGLAAAVRTLRIKVAAGRRR